MAEDSRMSPRRWWQREPVMFMAIVQSGLALVTAFGLSLTTAQIGAVMAFSAAVLGFVARSQVTPDSKPEALR